MASEKLAPSFRTREHAAPMKSSVYIATSLDGFIARPDGGIDWLEHDSGGDDYALPRIWRVSTPS